MPTTTRETRKQEETQEFGEMNERKAITYRMIESVMVERLQTLANCCLTIISIYCINLCKSTLLFDVVYKARQVRSFS